MTVVRISASTPDHGLAANGVIIMTPLKNYVFCFSNLVLAKGLHWACALEAPPETSGAMPLMRRRNGG